LKKLLYKATLFKPIPCGITNGKLILKEYPNYIVDKWVKKYHYSHKATQNRFLSFFIDECLFPNIHKGFIQLGYGIRPHIKHTISQYITANNYCEFDRMWLSDELPKNSESQVIGLLLSYLKQTCPEIKFVITYADGSVGNKGIIYQATNAISIGKVPVDFYLLPSGERIHPVSIWHRHKTRAFKTLEKIYPGIKHITNEWQYRYLYILNRRLRKKYQDRDTLVQQEGGGQFSPSAPMVMN